MAEVISLDGVREARKRSAPVPSFDLMMGRFFEALDLLDQGPARQAVYDGVEMLLRREEGVRHGR